MLYAERGVWWLRALVATAAGDRRQVGRSTQRFAEAAERAIGEPGDVASGSARLSRRRARMGGRGTASLRWSRATSRPPPAPVLALLERLIALRRPSGRGPVQAGSRVVRLGWCHGSAGWGQLWALAWELTGDKPLLDFAEQSAQDAVAAGDDNPSLCCGRAGQGYAALTLYRATGERRWLSDAHRVAAAAIRTPDPEPRPSHRLFSGDLGVALLAAELEDPARAAMPVYQPLRPPDGPAGYDAPTASARSRAGRDSRRAR